MSINHIGQILISVEDLGEAVTFYRDVLGLTHLFDVPSQEMSFFQVGQTRLYVTTAGNPGFESNPILYLDVDDIDAEHQRLANEGVEFMSVPTAVHTDESGVLWLSFFKTPGGLPTALMETRAVGGVP